MNKTTKTISQSSSSFFDGILSVFRALKLIKNTPRIYKFMAAPIIINIIVFAIAIYVGSHYFTKYIDRILPDGSTWIAILFYVIIVLFIIAVAAIIYFTFTAIAHLVAAPFNDLLSEEIEKKLTGKKVDEKFSFSKILEDVGRTMKNEIKKFLLFGFFQVIILVFNLIPVIGQFIYAALSILITAYVLGYGYFAIPCDRQRIPLLDQFAYIRKNKMLFLGFGLISSFLIIIPILNLFFLPVCVVAGTIHYVNLIKKDA